ncbi:hypothetical protein G5I_12702 [Acromyrmex echinatior]|uniref:DUF8207 domain-containing protein n=1 Tax=Acromyrmex echinatior TaxID=103372 RepID=F4X313_ACREC|nr:hypothetical protein G5I_12702 [Acromyrmex echinatior]
MTEDSLATKIQNQLQTSEDREALRAGLDPLDELIFGNKRFDVDNVIIDVRYAGTPGLIELIFKRISNDLLYTEGDKHKYKSMLLATNAHQHKHHSQGRVLSNKGYKYKYVTSRR